MEDKFKSNAKEPKIWDQSGNCVLMRYNSFIDLHSSKFLFLDKVKNCILMMHMSHN